MQLYVLKRSQIFGHARRESSLARYRSAFMREKYAFEYFLRRAPHKLRMALLPQRFRISSMTI
jgi:hypothetical protein